MLTRRWEHGLKSTGRKSRQRTAGLFILPRRPSVYFRSIPSWAYDRPCGAPVNAPRSRTAGASVNTSAYVNPPEHRDAAKTPKITLHVHDTAAADDVAFEVAENAVDGTGDILDAAGQEMLEGAS